MGCRRAGAGLLSALSPRVHDDGEISSLLQAARLCCWPRNAMKQVCGICVARR